MELWLCGQLKKYSKKGSVWEFQGIFSTKNVAIEACKNEKYFIYPVKLDEELPEESVIPNGALYPLVDIPEYVHKLKWGLDKILIIGHNHFKH